MKKASTLISAIIAIVVLLAALGVGFSVKQFRIHRAEKIAQARPAPEVKRPLVNPALPGRGQSRRSDELTAEQRNEIRDQRARTMERVDNMSEDERREFMRAQGERFDAGGRRDSSREGREGREGMRRPGGFGDMSEEERQAMRERFENMTEEERQQFRDQMRSRFGGRRRTDRGGDPGATRDGSLRRGSGGEEMTEPRPDGPGEN